MTLPEKLGICKFVDETYEAYPDLVGVAPSTDYVRIDLVQALVDALESAHNGLKWWREEYPARGSGADDEMDEQINKAMAPFITKEE